MAIFFFSSPTKFSRRWHQRRGEIIFYLLARSGLGVCLLHACMHVLYLCGTTGSVLVLGNPQKEGAVGREPQTLGCFWLNYTIRWDPPRVTPLAQSKHANKTWFLRVVTAMKCCLNTYETLYFWISSGEFSCSSLPFINKCYFLFLWFQL